MPTVSVIMAVYNGGVALRPAIESVLDQSFRDLELIVVDDGSTDSSSALCDDFALRDPRVRVLHQRNAGLAAARNAALDVATGKYVAFCDADDEYRPAFCAQMVEGFAVSAVDLVVCGCEVVDETGRGGDYIRSRVNEQLANPCLGLIRAGTEERFWSVNTTVWNKLFRRDVLDRFGIRFPSGHENEDDPFCYQYAMVSGDALLIPDRLYRYHLRQGSIMDAYVSRMPKNRWDRLACAEYLTDFARRNGLEVRFGAFLVRLWFEYYRMVKSFFTDGELVEVRRWIMQRAASCFSRGNLLVDCEDDLFYIDRAGNAVDHLKAIWHRVRRFTAFGNAERSAAISRKALRCDLIWRCRHEPCTGRGS